MIIKANLVRNFHLFLPMCALLMLAGTSAFANPRPLPFTYPYATLAEGSSEVELYGDMTPLRVLADPADVTRGHIWEPAYHLQAEFEYGITDRWELGIYQVFNADPVDGGGNAMSFDGFKWRVRTRLAEAGELPVDIGFYVELETMHDELALEEKVLLEKDFGRLRVMSNLWIEEVLDRPYDSAQREFEFVINPTLGATYELSPRFHVGGEYWARGQLSPEGETPVDEHNARVHHFIGPTAHLNFGRLWLSLGAYAHLNDMTRPQPGEVYGPVWFRSVLGIEL